MFSVEGWLIERSAAYRHLLGTRRLLRSRGPEGKGGVAGQVEEHYRMFGSFELHLASLDRIIRPLGSARVIVIGMPVNPKHLAALHLQNPLYERKMKAVNQGLLPDPAAQAAAAGNSG